METAEYLKSLREDIAFSTKLADRQFQFHTTWGLFSPREIDEGTLLLARYLDIPEDSDCLDLGCGYGPIGMLLAYKAPEGQTTLVDKDFVAVDYANANIDRNRIPNAQAQLSNGFEQLPVEQQFDVIVSNIPAKVGKELLALWMYEAHRRLRSGGSFYVVTVNGLRQFMKRYMTEVFDNYDKIKQGKTYTVAVTRKA